LERHRKPLHALNGRPAEVDVSQALGAHEQERKLSRQYDRRAVLGIRSCAPLSLAKLIRFGRSYLLPVCRYKDGSRGPLRMHIALPPHGAD
ncbi:hypothetical protein, partial [Paraburkholderia mimosarum]|uniref:hypothetical protein n=1 Tax=Paraburkholderia mimosarum TaxID=312026 RepID=UPI001C3F4E1E